MHELIEKNVIRVTTQSGQCQVMLYLGDITLLPMEEKVDMVMVSAFPGDYIASAGSLIGNLQKNLGVSVRKLSMEKDMDLRKHFHCWLSKPLPDHLPYRRLLCFERHMQKIMVHPAALVGDVFRCLTPIFSNQDSTIITPLLATGVQKFSPTVMLKAMVDAACNWMKAGLPLRQLKIVIYTKTPGVLTEEERDVVDLFDKLKQKWEKKGASLKLSPLQYDVYFSFSHTDEDKMMKVKKSLEKKHKNINIFMEKQEIWTDHAWQEAMFEKMTACKRIVALLSPSYLDSAECIEQFNIAVCCSRLQIRTLLVPLYVESVPSMPAYIQLVQYIDCREELPEFPLQRKISRASKQIIKSITDKSASSQEERKQETYDIFISYSHRQSEEAEYFLDLLKTHSPETKVFFDRSGLETGKSWQKTLYTVLGTVRCVVAMVTSDYLKSPVCQEEYNISLYRAHLEANTGSFLLVPVCIDPNLKSIPNEFCHVKLVDGRSDLFKKTLREVCNSLTTWLLTGHKSTIFPTIPAVGDINSLTQSIREKYIEDNYHVDNHRVEKKGYGSVLLDDPKSPPQKIANCEVYCCYGNTETHLVAILSQLLKDKVPDLTMNLGLGSPQERLSSLDAADHVVLFISSSFVKSSQLMNNLHMSLCRRRALGKPNLVYAILNPPIEAQPIFLHLLPYSINLGDRVWEKMQKSTTHIDNYRSVVVSGDLKGSYRCTHKEMIALRKAALELAELILLQRRGGSVSPQKCVNLVNIASLKQRVESSSQSPHSQIEQVLWNFETSFSSNQSDTEKHSPKLALGEIEHCETPVQNVQSVKTEMTKCKISGPNQILVQNEIKQYETVLQSDTPEEKERGRYLQDNSPVKTGQGNQAAVERQPTKAEINKIHRKLSEDPDDVNSECKAEEEGSEEEDVNDDIDSIHEDIHTPELKKRRRSNLCRLV